MRSPSRGRTVRHYVQDSFEGRYRSRYLAGNPGLYFSDRGIQRRGKARLASQAFKRASKSARNRVITIHGTHCGMELADLGSAFP